MTSSFCPALVAARSSIGTRAGPKNFRRQNASSSAISNIPVLAEWTQRIEAAASAATRPVVFVAHSLGTIAAVHAAPQMPNVIGAMLVAPPSPDVVLTLPQIDPAFAHVKPAHLAFPALVVASRNDTYSTYEQATEFASALGATLVGCGRLRPPQSR